MAAIKQLSNYLRQKYDVDSEFTPTLPYDPAKAYKATNRVYLDATAYSASSTYVLNQLCLQGGKVYQCSTAISSPEAFNTAHWTLLGDRYDIFFAAYPFPLFNINASYRKDDKVFWKDHIYTCLRTTVLLSHESELQYAEVDNLPLKNVFPDDLVNGRSYWHDEGAYAVPPSALLVQNSDPETVQFIQAREDYQVQAGVSAIEVNDVLQTMQSNTDVFVDDSLEGWSYGLERVGYGTMQPDVDYAKDAKGWHLLKSGDKIQAYEKFVHHFVPVYSTTLPDPLPGAMTVSQQISNYFIKGDNRNALVLMYVVDVAIYHLYGRLNRPIPENKCDRYNAAIAELKMMAKGDISSDMQKLQPDQGSRIRWGSNVKQNNSY